MAQAGTSPAEGHQEHPLGIYLAVWILLFVLSTFSYLVDYMQLQGMLRWSLILIFMFLKAGFIVAILTGSRSPDQHTVQTNSSTASQSIRSRSTVAQPSATACGSIIFLRICLPSALATSNQSPRVSWVITRRMVDLSAGTLTFLVMNLA